MSAGWRFHKPDELHPWADVVPVDDEFPSPHATASFEESCACHCQPDVKYADDDGTPFRYPMVVHSAYDGRDLVEQAERILRDAFLKPESRE